MGSTKAPPKQHSFKSAAAAAQQKSFKIGSFADLNKQTSFKVLARDWIVEVDKKKRKRRLMAKPKKCQPSSPTTTKRPWLSGRQVESQKDARVCSSRLPPKSKTSCLTSPTASHVKNPRYKVYPSSRRPESKRRSASLRRRGDLKLTRKTASTLN